MPQMRTSTHKNLQKDAFHERQPSIAAKARKLRSRGQRPTAMKRPCLQQAGIPTSGFDHANKSRENTMP